MEMEYKDPSKRGRWIVLLGVVLAVAAGGAAFFLINNAQQQAGQSGLKTTTAVVAIKPIAARKPIEAAEVAVRTDIPLDGTNAEGLITDPAQVVGRILAVDVKTGQLITTNLLASTTAGAEFSILKPDETVAPDSEAWRAVSLTVTDDRAVGGMLGPGMMVDVFMTASINVPQSIMDKGQYYTDQSTKISWQNMQILSRQGTFYIVKATLPVAEEISHLQAAGNASFSMVLRPDADTRILDISALGATTNRIIQRYGLPIPETYPRGEGPVATSPPIPEITPAPTVDPNASPSPAPSGSAAP
jgi:Flp pilus assembly protein CpaB